LLRPDLHRYLVAAQVAQRCAWQDTERAKINRALNFVKRQNRTA
jgi:hypothetical protein